MSVVLVKEPTAGTMHSRGGFPVKTLIYAVFILFLVYMFYIYNNSQNNLREAEMTGARYKREAEERVTEIQELIRGKDRFQESCQNEKTELLNRLKSLNQQYSMVQSQYKETEADFIKLRQDMDTLRSEHAQADNSHAAEYEKLKQEKENSITQLKDQIADLTEQTNNLGKTVTGLRQKIADSEATFQAQKEESDNLEQNFYSLQNAYKVLLNQNLQLQQLHEKPQTSQQDSKQLPAVSQQQDHAIKVEGVNTVKQLPPSPVDNLGQGNLDAVAVNKDVNPVAGDDNLNGLRQVQPPNNNINIVDAGGDNDKKKGYSDVHFQGEVNPNDEQKAQILEPVLEHNDKHQGGGGEDGVLAMNARLVEEAREKNANKEESDSLLPKNPLALGQIEVPGDNNGIDNAADQNKNNGGQQLPPLLNEDNEQKDQDRGENHYFGEDEDAQQQQQQDDQRQEEDRQQMDEEEQDQADDFENNADHFPDDPSNQANKDAALADVNNN